MRRLPAVLACCLAAALPAAATADDRYRAPQSAVPAYGDYGREGTWEYHRDENRRRAEADRIRWEIQQGLLELEAERRSVEQQRLRTQDPEVAEQLRLNFEARREDFERWREQMEQRRMELERQPY